MTGNPEGTLSLDDAVDRWMAAEPETDQGAEETNTEAEPDEGNSEEVEMEAAGDDADEDTEVEDDASEDDDPEFEIETPKGAQRVKLSELRAGYMRQSDYTRKTMEVAEQRRQAERVEAETSQLKQQLSEALQTWAVPTEQEPDWAELAQKLDPREFNSRRVQWEQRQQRKEQARQQWQQMQAHEMAQIKAREQAALLDVFPEWREPAKFYEAARKLAAGAEAYGIASEEVGNIADHRLVRVLRDAVAYRELMAKQPAAAKKVAKPQPSLKPGSKPNRTLQKDADRQKQLSRLKQTGSITDAVDLLLSG